MQIHTYRHAGMFNFRNINRQIPLQRDVNVWIHVHACMAATGERGMSCIKQQSDGTGRFLWEADRPKREHGNHIYRRQEEVVYV